MSQNDYVIANQTAPNFRADLNLALQALASTSSGATAPSTTYANMLWYDSGTNILKMRSEADDAWINLGTLDQSLNTFAPAGVAKLTQVQAEDDTSTVFGQVSGQRLGQAVAANSAPLTAGAVGTYVWAWRNGTDVGVGFGDVVAGSELRPAGFGGNFTVATNRTSLATTQVLYSNSGTDQAVLSGTWRAMGDYDYSFSDDYVHTLFLRIT